jgi:hypothetical protein
MTKKHFIAMAAEFQLLIDTVGTEQEKVGIKHSVGAFIRVAQQDNPKFDAARFRTACGLED